MPGRWLQRLMGLASSDPGEERKPADALLNPRSLRLAELSDLPKSTSRQAEPGGAHRGTLGCTCNPPGGGGQAAGLGGGAAGASPRAGRSGEAERSATQRPSQNSWGRLRGRGARTGTPRLTSPRPPRFRASPPQKAAHLPFVQLLHGRRGRWSGRRGCGCGRGWGGSRTLHFALTSCRETYARYPGLPPRAHARAQARRRKRGGGRNRALASRPGARGRHPGRHRGEIVAARVN